MPKRTHLPVLSAAEHQALLDGYNQAVDPETRTRYQMLLFGVERGWTTPQIAPLGNVREHRVKPDRVVFERTGSRRTGQALGHGDTSTSLCLHLPFLIPQSTANAPFLNRGIESRHRQR